MLSSAVKHYFVSPASFQHRTKCVYARFGVPITLHAFSISTDKCPQRARCDYEENVIL